MLTEAQLADFRRTGLLHLPGLLPPGRMTPASDKIMKICRKAGAWRRNAWHLDTDPTTLARLRRRIADSNAIGNLMTADLRSCIAALVHDRSIHERTARPNLLVTLPVNLGGRPDFDWHIDARRLSGLDMAGVQLFSFINTVGTGGGAPLAVTGSHRIETPENLPRERVREALRQHAFFQNLLAAGSNDRPALVDLEEKVDGVPLNVVEMTGEPGDVWLMDLWLLHTRCPNERDEARLMVTQRFLLDAAWERLGARVG